MGDFEVVMEGGRPWGIRMQGGKGSGTHLKVAQVTAGSKAASVGVQTGIHILEINGNVTTNLTMVEAQNIIKGTGDKLKLRLVNPADCQADNEEDNFLEDLKKSMATGDSGSSAVKGSTFKMLQGHIDAGQTGSILTAWDKPANWTERNQSVPTNAPKVQAVEKGYDKTSFGLDDDLHARQTAFMVEMTGGKPWGLKLQGGRGTGTPLCIASVTHDSKAHTKRLLVGDEIHSINANDARQLTMTEAQDLIKKTGDRLKLSVIKHGLKNAEQCGPTASEIETMETRVNEEEDPEFFKSLANSVKGGKEDWSGRQVKGGAFKMLQNVVDSGQVSK